MTLLLFLVGISTSFSQEINIDLVKTVRDGYGGSAPYLHNANSVFVLDNYAYIVGGGNALEIVDITLPGQPIHKGSLEIDEGGANINNPQQVFVAKDISSGRTYAYMSILGLNAASGNFHGLEIVDVTDPTAPTHKSFTYYNDARGMVGIFVLGNYVYLTGYHLYAFDVTNRANPVHIGTAELEGDRYYCDARSVHVAQHSNGQTYAYMAYSNDSGGPNAKSLAIYNVTNPASMFFAGRLSDYRRGAGSFARGQTYTIVTSGTTDFTSIGAANNNVGTLFTATAVGSGTGTAFAIPGGGNFNSLAGNFKNGQTYSIVTPGNTNFTLIGAANNNVGTVFTASGVGAGTGTAFAVTGAGIFATPAGSFNIGGTYTIVTAGTTNFTLIGAQNNNPGTVFIATGVGTGTGIAFRNGDQSIMGQDGNFATRAPYLNFLKGFTPGHTYSIVTPGNTDFTSIGAANNTIGTVFTATGVGTGTGTAFAVTAAGNFKVGNTYIIISPGTTNFTSIGAANSNVGTLFTATAVGSGTGAAVGVSAFIFNPQSVFVSGNYAYVASTGSNAMEIVNITDPTRPTHEGKLLDGGGVAPFLNEPFWVTVEGNYAYVASKGSNALEKINISNPAAPTHAGSLVNGYEGALLDQPVSVATNGNTAFVVSKTSTLEIADMNGMGAPTHRASLANSKKPAVLTNPQSVFVKDNFAYVSSAGGNTLEILDVTNPVNPVHKSSLNYGMGGVPNNTGPTSIFVSGNHAYMANYNNNRLEIIDVSNPSFPVLKSGLANGAGGGALLSNPISVYVSGNFAYVASTGSNALEIVDVSNPTSPVHRASVSIPGPVSVTVSGNYAYVISGSTMRIIDITNPASPIQRSSTNISPSWGVIVEGNYAYVLAERDGVYIYNVSNPMLPAVYTGHGPHVGNGYTRSFSKSGKLILLAIWSANETFWINVTDPSLPIAIETSANVASLASSVFISGNYVYMTRGGLNILEIYNLFGPAIASFTPATGAPGTTVTLTGTNYNTIMTATFNGTGQIAPVPGSVTATSAQFIVPNNSKIGKISVTNNSLTVSSAANFLVIPTALPVTNIGQNGFTANWSDVGAVNYYLDVSTNNFSTFVVNNLNVGNVTSRAVTGLTPGTTYQYRVRSSDGSGTSGNSNIISSILTIPATPTVNAATVITQTGFTANWVGGVTNATGYYLDVATDAGFTTFVPGYINLSLSSGTSSQIVSGLNSGTYYYRVRSFNGSGVSPSSSTITAITLPSTPVAIAATAINASGFTANWSLVVGATSYSLDVSTNNFATFVSGYNNLNVGAVTTLPISSLSSGISYQYRVRANNGSGSSGNSIVTALLTLPAAPPALPAISVLPNQFNARWTQVASATGYLMDVADNIGFSPAIATNIILGDVSTYTVTSLTSSTQYFYRVRASNPTGNSGYSTVIPVTTLANPVSNQSYAITFSTISSNSITLSFTPGSASASHLVVASAGSPLITALPVNQTTYTSNLAYGIGDAIGNGYVVSAGSATTITVTNLLLATTYYFQVFEFSGSVGTQNYLTSTASGNPAPQSTLASTSASQPTNLTFSNITSTGAAISFTAASGNPGGYLVVRSSTSTLPAPPANGTTYTAGQSLGSATVVYAGSTASFNEAALLAGTTYLYSVYAYNGSGSTINYLITNPLQGSVIMLPPTPTVSDASPIGANEFTANWSAVTGASDYYLDVSTDNFNTFVAGYNNLPVGSAVSYNVIGLSSGSTYQYRVRASNISGNSGNSTSKAVLTRPSPPQGLTAANITQNAFTASWTKVGGASAYSLDVAADSLFTSITYGNISLGNTASYLVSGLSPSSTYYFRLRASNSSGVSSNSAFVALTTLAASVTTQSSALTFSSVTGTSITLNYTPGSGTSHLVVVSQGLPLTALPSNRSSYTGSTVYSQGSKIGNGYVLTLGLSPVTVTGLSPATTYYFQVFDFNGSGGTENYNTITIAAANNPASQITLSTIPVEQPKNLTFSNQTGTSVNVSFTPANGSPAGYLVLRASGSPTNTAPLQGSAYAIGTSLGNATIAYAGSSISFFEGGLPTSTKYHYSVYAFNGNGGSVSYLTASPLQGSVTLDVAPPVITAAVTNLATITKLSTPILSATITDNVSVASAQLFYRGISQKEFKVATMNPLAGNTYSATVQTDWYDEMGLEYYFMATDGNGNSTPKPTSIFAHLKTQSFSLPTLPSGSTQGSYRIIAFPYVLPAPKDNKVETIYGNDFKDNTKASLLWWDPTQKGGAGDYLRYGTETGIQTVDPGKGYWVLTSGTIKPQLDEVPAPKFNRSNLYEMTLKPKWNEIGNPYPVAISWDDVIAFNEAVNPGAVFSKLNVYDGTSYKEASANTLLNAFEGGFVKNMSSSDIKILIPFPGQTNGGRVAFIGSDISKEQWNIRLHIQQGDYANELGGFGMHPLSIAGQDRHDNFNPPRLMDVPEVNFTNSEVPSLLFSNDMVPTANEYVWQFTPAGNLGKPAQLNWNLPSVSGSQQLFLLDEEQLKVIDMSQATQYNFVLTSSTRFRIFFGRDIQKKITPQNIAASTPFPNPLAADLRATINVALPDSGDMYQVNLQIFNLQGVQMESIDRSFKSGIHPVEFELNNTIATNMYLYRLAVSSDKSSKVFTGKIMKP